MKKILKYKYVFPIVIVVGIFLSFVAGYIYSGIKFVPPHFHANFALYVDGQKWDFTDDKYMEDVAGCSVTGLVYPKDRVHLHENNGDTIHIHSEGVAWGHFFANNQFSFGENFLSLDNGDLLFSDDAHSLTYILNGEVIDNPFNRLIQSEDKLLINYGGDTSQEIQKYYETVSSNAGEYNSKYDPGSCGGTNENSVFVLLKEMFTFTHTH